jgi:hypothetical protein
LNVNGNEEVSEFPVAEPIQLIDATTDYAQGFPDVASFDGGFIVTWTSEDTANGTYDVHGQVFNNDGSKIGSEFIANSTTVDNQSNSVISVLPDGSFVIAWQSDTQFDGSANDWGIYGQRFVIDTRGNDAPTDLFLSSDYIWEDWGPQIIGQFTAFDVDNGDSFDYQLVSSTGDGASFTLVNNSLYLDTPLSYEDFYNQDGTLIGGVNLAQRHR